MGRKKTAQTSLLDEIIVDNFAGGGGASTGIELACGKPVDIAINHDPEAIKMHMVNHPYTVHYQACYLHTEPCDNAKGYKGVAVCVEDNSFCNYGERTDNNAKIP